MMVASRRTLLLVLCCWTFFAGSASSAENTLSESEKRAGWKLLFDGKTKAGWRNYKHDKISDDWVVEDGALSRNGARAGDIVTTDQYDSFELSIEYVFELDGRVNPGDRVAVIVLRNCEPPHQLRGQWVRPARGEAVIRGGTLQAEVEGC